MSFSISLYNCNSDSMMVTKSLVNMGSIIYTNFRDEYDLINPVFIIQTGGIDPVTIYNANAGYYDETQFKIDIQNGAINYLSINLGTTASPFIRYYYIRSVNYIQNNLLELTCHEDVLMTFGSIIRTFTGIIRRNENAYNLYIKDEKIGVYENAFQRQLVFSKGFTNTSLTYIVTTAGVMPKKVTDNPEANVTIICNLASNTYPAGGGEIIWLPLSYCDDCTVKTSSSFYDFKIAPEGEWVICNEGALYPNRDSNRWCVAQVTGWDENAGTLSLAPIQYYNFNDSIIVTTTAGALFKAYSWSVGGVYDSGTQEYSTKLMINNVLTTTGQSRSYREPTETQLQTTSSNTFGFYTSV